MTQWGFNYLPISSIAALIRCIVAPGNFPGALWLMSVGIPWVFRR